MNTETNVLRKESAEKVTGRIDYLNDISYPQLLHGAVKVSPHAYAKIKNINIEKAAAIKGVKAILLGKDFDQNLGLYLCDKPAIARNYVRHHGEVVASVVATSYEIACRARDLIEVEYEVLKPILSPSEALAENAPLLHPEMGSYSHINPIHPEPGSNIANRTKIRKGDIEIARSGCSHITEARVEIPIGDHVAMEPRGAIAEIKKNGDVIIVSSTQAPFVVKELMSNFFKIPSGKIVVKAPFLGGGFGGKAGIQLEGLAYLLSLMVDGRPVKLINTREEDLITSPGHIGLEAKVRIGVDANGFIQFMDMDYHFNSGAYADYAVNVSRAAAISCTGPYNVPNVRCDSLCVYTNLPFATAYRGFGHVEMGFAIERAMDILAREIGMNPFELRWKNRIKEGDLSPVQSVMNSSTGDLGKCLEVVNEKLGGDVDRIDIRDNRYIRARGISSLWKAPAMPTNTDAGAIITFNSDGSCNIQTGVVEIGQGTKTGLAELASERLGIPIDKVHVQMEVDTRVSPSDWATAASRGLFMAGNAVLEACDDAINQIKFTASQALRVSAVDLHVHGERVFVKGEPHIGLMLKEVVLGYVYPNGNAIVGQVIGKGRYIAKHLTDIDAETGKGHPDLEWTIGAEGVEIELDKLTGKYKVLKAICCIDVGKVINHDIARGQIVGGMAMGIGYTTMEAFKHNDRGQIQNNTLRDYKIMRYKDAPEYEVVFLETPQWDGPMGARGLGEQSVIGMPGAVSNALSRAAGFELSQIPITPEKILGGML